MDNHLIMSIQHPVHKASFILLLIAVFFDLTHLATPRITQANEPQESVIGTSTEGRPINAIRFGDGKRKLVVVGDTHGGAEANTYTLTLQLIDYFNTNTEQIPASVSLYFIPTLNPDGLELGWRFNANGVDLNRNMNTNIDECSENDWRVRVYGAYGTESDTGGPYAESEAESRVIRDFLLDASGAIFLHSAAGLVFPAFCEHTPSIEMAQVYAEAADYTYERYWDAYFITGGMHDWAGSLGIAAITPELISGTESEFEQNLAGLLAVLANDTQLLPLPEDQEEANIEIPALIWRYWQAHGGADLFGAPLAPAEQDGAITRQVFERAILEHRPNQAGTPRMVQPLPLGREVLAGREFATVEPTPDARFFPETGHTIRESFQSFWEQHSGEYLFGAPLSEEHEEWTADGQRRIVQYFEHAVFAYYPEDDSVQLEPLGWQRLIHTEFEQTTAVQQIR
ncbi:MAG: peptidase M14 [Chloroflexi bacterium AL-W]|nr:peptidase M14 [Chloroflexi bacterium AL-N1]NOK70598.1 peptidase M14 [Chloroflexi bacterium AL-N10]NOK77590.1 peptidase M14 [Chloroflexi bacterium AL-N5]NOK84441.1 peptidase M14 [Chloroflexi bacterium AL-W]NOK92330.1 peptidase M14 [Chloroflexi bacterium AL-N15]